jgi:hypothetical protein
MMQSYTGLIGIGIALVNNETIYDDFTEEFRQMVFLARKVLERAEAARLGGTKVFSFSIWVVTSLYFVVNKCRNLAIRREVIELCDKYPRQDGAWDSAMAAAIGRWNIEKEKGLEMMNLFQRLRGYALWRSRFHQGRGSFSYDIR